MSLPSQKADVGCAAVRWNLTHDVCSGKRKIKVVSVFSELLYLITGLHKRKKQLRLMQVYGWFWAGPVCPGEGHKHNHKDEDTNDEEACG